MTTAPLLTEADLRVEIERLFRHKHRNHLVALYGRGEPGRFELDGSTWNVVPTRCELDLRAQLPVRDDPTLRTVYLVDWAEDALPLDVGCRLAGGRIYHVARDARLAALFGARQVDGGLAGTALARLLLSGELTGLRKVSGLRLTRDEAWLRFVEARLGLPEDATGDAAALLRWTRGNDGGPAFARQGESDETLRAVQHELRDWLADRLKAIGLLVWRAWETGQTDRLLQVLVLLDAGQCVDDAFTRGLLGGQVAAWLPGLSRELQQPSVALAAGGVVSAVLDPQLEADRRLLAAAERLAGGANLGALGARSGWLPAGHVAREARFAERLDGFLAAASGETLAAVLAALEHLGAHRLDPGVTALTDARRMAARLATWLLTRRVRAPLATYGAAWQPAVELARRYSEEGGHRDWARQALRGLRGATPELDSAVRRLLSAVDEEVRDDDRRFAEAYVSWLEAAKPAGEVVPIEHVARRIVTPFLRGNTQRKLLVVLMDGMSQTTVVQLLHRLASQRKWGPIAWRVPAWQGHLPVPPVLAVAPTLTQVSRAALFAGTADPRFGDESTDRDEARWAANPHVREILGESPAAVFVRRDVHAGHELVGDVKAVIAGEDRVVAVIVNAIDEQLKGSIQVGLDYSVTPILPLEALLTAAEGAERAVLLVADHGHVPGDAMRVAGGRSDGGRPGGARWRALGVGEHPGADEVRLPPTCWKPRGWDGVAVLWNPSLAHRSPNHGEHGGLSLAEAVAPALLVGPEWLDRVAGEDPELSARPVPTPDWWDLRMPRPPSTPRVAAAARVPEAPGQMPLLAARPPVLPALVEPEVVIEPDLVRALRASRPFREHVRGIAEVELERVLGWLAPLADAGSMPAADFAVSCGVRPHQVGGVVARMGILNADGFPMVEYDMVGRRVLLHRARLSQQFGIGG